MKVTNKYYIGTHVMFYEIKVLREMVQSYKNAIDIVENKENITFELFLICQKFLNLLILIKFQKKSY